jgi:hypothetical protein
MWHMWSLILVRLVTVLVWEQDRCTVCAKHTIGTKLFWTHRWYSEVRRLKWKLISVCLEIVLILRKIGALFAPNVPLARKFFWTHPMELLGDVGHVESCFSLIGDRVSISAREVHGLRGTVR